MNGQEPELERRTTRMVLSKKFYIALICTTLFICAASHGEWIELNPAAPGTSPEITVLSSNDSKTIIEFNIPGFELDEVPVISRLIAVPRDCDITLKIVESDHHLFPEVNVTPHQMDAFSTIQKTQSVTDMVVLGQPGILRDLSIVPLTIFPVRYDTDRKELQVYSHLRIELNHTGPGRIRVEGKSGNLSQAFRGIYRSLILNYNFLGIDDNDYQRGSYLIITHDTFFEHVQSLAQWKHMQGWQTSVVKLSEISSNPTKSEIRDFILDAYTNWDLPPEYVLLVGDTDIQGIGKFPSFYIQTPGGGDTDVTDHPYSLMAGEDYFSDLFVGRLSVDTINDVIVVVNKILNYERQPYTGQTDWFKKALVIAGNYSETPPIPSTPRLTSLWLRDKMLANGYSEVDTVFYPPTTGPQLISASIDRGVGIVNYRGWGDANGWHYPNFKVDDILSLNNGLMLPVMFSIVCNSGDFDNQIVDPCFGEIWLRAGTAMNPKGGVAFFGPSDLYTSTKYNNAIDAGMFWGIFDEGLSSLGAVTLRGKLEMYNGFPNITGPDDWVEFYFHVYNILGDPSLEIWTDIPQSLTVSHPPEMFIGQNPFEVTVHKDTAEPVEGASVCLLKDEDVFAQGFTDQNGTIGFSILPATAGTLFVTVTAHNFSPYLSYTLISESYSYIGYYDHDIDDSQGGNNDGRVNQGETVLLPITVMNYGTGHISIAVSGTLKTEDPHVTVTDSVAIYGNIVPGGSSTSADGFEISVHSPCSHGQRIHFELITRDDLGVYTSEFDITVSGPDVIYANHEIENEGGNGVLDPGETADCIVTISNDGLQDVSGVTGTLICWNDAVTILDATGTFPDIPCDGTGTNELDPYTLSISPSAAVGRFIPFAITITGDNGYSDTTSFSLTIGEVTSVDPLGPDSYGYYAYDNTDVSYSEAPTYSWTEIDPDYGGSGTKIIMGDDDERVLDLPFTFRYYGSEYDEITICSNGWIAMGETWMNDFRNWGIPAALGPYGMIAPFWDDLDSTLVSETVQDEVHVCYQYESGAHRFIVEWSRALNHYDSSMEVMQAVLYDHQFHHTGTGDGDILFQYHTVNNTDTRSNYATVGIESPTQADGLEYTFANRYPPAAAPLVSGLAIKFTTDPPDTFQTGIEDGRSGHVPAEYALSQNHPNPFNPSTDIRYQIADNGYPLHTTLKIYNILGQEIRTLVDEMKKPGYHAVIWDGRDSRGNEVTSGIYFYRLSVDGGQWSKTRRMVLMK